MDHAAWLEAGMNGASEDEREAYQYFMRVDPTMRDILGPIETVEDELTGRPMRRRWAKIGMTRNPKPENMREVWVYLDPLPHTRLEKAKDLQGWYQSKSWSGGSRPRPCMTDAILTEPYGGTCTVGCSFSLVRGERINTPSGMRAIETLDVGDIVWGRSNSGVIPTSVLGKTRHWKAQGYVELRLSNGVVLKLTADHPIFSADRKTWVAAEELNQGECLEEIQFGRDGAARSNRTRKTYSGAEGCWGGALSPDDSGQSEEISGAPEGMGISAEGRSQESRLEFRRDDATRPGRTRKEEGPWDCFSFEGTPQVCSDPQEDVRSSIGPQGGYVETGQRTEIPFLALGPGGTCSERIVGLSAISASGFYGPQGARIPHAVFLGSVDSFLVGQEGSELGLRTGDYPSPQWETLHSGFPFGGREFFGSQGIRGVQLGTEGAVGEGVGVSCFGAHEETLTEVGGVRVEKLTRVVGGLYVYDIQTETQNFYQRGVLVHNCYINSGFRGYRGSGLVTVPINYGEQIRAQLRSMNISAAGYFSSFTDPFLPVEDYYHNTQRGAQEFVNAGLPVFFLSRLSYPDWAIDLLRKNKYSYAQKSINTSDPEDWKKLSPGALPLEQHMEEIRKLHAAGVYVSIQCNPVVPGIVTHEDIEKLIDMLSEAGADHVIVKFVEANAPWAPAMVARITQRFGDNRSAAFRDLFTEKSCGSQRTIAEEYRREGHERYRKRAMEAGMTYSLCYEYTQRPDGVWKSMGPEYLTADQCHGHRVPMHVRMGERFSPLSTCPTAGCLSCGDEAGKGKCGSELLGQAKALRLPDLRKSFDGKVKIERYSPD